MVKLVELFQLDELKGYRNVPEIDMFRDATQDLSKNHLESRKNILQNFLGSLQEKGYTPLGSGAFGLVFTSPDLNYVVKIFKNDPAYMSFLEFCYQNQNLACLPKLRGRPMSIDKELYLIRMERLAPIADDRSEMIVALLGQFADSRTSLEGFLRMMKKDATDGDLYATAALEHFDNDSAVWEVVDMLKTQRGAKQYRMDLHPGNFMKRPADGQIVIVDPYLDYDQID